MAIQLDGKYIPIEYYREYNGYVRPDEKRKITTEGEERPSLVFPFRLTLDKFGHIYLIPLLLVKRNEVNGYEPAYSINDVVEASSGNARKRELIDNVHANLQEKFLNHHVMQDAFVNEFWRIAKDLFAEKYVETFGKQVNVPSTVTTYENLTADEAEELASKALIAANGNSYG